MTNGSKSCQTRNLSPYTYSTPGLDRVFQGHSFDILYEEEVFAELINTRADEADNIVMLMNAAYSAGYYTGKTEKN